jgi:Uma2 family endonuclease
MSLTVKKRVQIYTYKDYLSWPEEERWELIDGRPYAMTPAPSTRHQRVIMELGRQIANFLLNKKCNAFPALFDVRFADKFDDDEMVTTVVQPDIVVICDKTKIDEKGCKGAPDIVIEILSPETGDKDKKEKFALYEKQGVKEYWLVDPFDNTVMVFKLKKNEYGKPEVYAKNDHITTNILKGLKINLKLVFK